MFLFAPTRDVCPKTLDPRERYDFHSHTFLSDGSNAPTDMWSEAAHRGHVALAVTDHVAMEDPRPLLARLREEASSFEDGPLTPIIGVELSKVPPTKIAEAARRARRAGAEIIIVHGETLMDVVPPGTNHAAVDSGEVDVLAHPGLLTEADAQLACDHETFLELSARAIHSFTNGHVATVALKCGAAMVVDSDAHDVHQLVEQTMARNIASGAGVPGSRLAEILRDAPVRLLKRCKKG
jgi:putative hydrolase